MNIGKDSVGRRAKAHSDHACPHCQRVLHTHKGAFATHLRWCAKDRPSMFWALVDKRGPEECWPWIGGMKSKTDPIQAYGVYGIKRKQRNAHRVAYIFTHGDPGPGFNVCHRCDNPRCCNPSHLFAATQKENVKDMIDKGRAYITRCRRKRGRIAKEVTSTRRNACS